MQIHKLPPGYRKKNLVTNLTEKKVGKVIDVEIDIEGVNNFVRVRVKLVMRKALARFVTVVRGGQREFYPIKFEKMPKFCGACGFFGHIHLECGSGEYDESMLQWGDWLKAEWETWHGRIIGGNHGGGRGARGGGSSGEGRGRDPMGRGRGANVSWCCNALTYGADGTADVDEEIADTGTSPPKKHEGELDDRELSDPGTKRRLNLDLMPAEEDAPPRSANNNDIVIPMITDGVAGELPIENNVTTRTKRSKKDGANSPSLGSAGSFKGSVRSQ
jgi:hypothetical protein